MAARTSGPSEGRVPCPLCGGLIHPIAGRCKHCKADITALRGTRSAAAAALPPLAPVATPATVAAPPAPAATVHAPQRSAEPALAHAATPAPLDDARPILPPRPTDHAPIASPRSAWRNWPMIVIGVAAIAIAAAVVMMVWPPASSAKSGTRRLPPPPAPERMDTNPLPQPAPAPTRPPASGSDPWSSRGAVPRVQPPQPVAPPPDDPYDDEPDDASDDDSDVAGALGSIDPDDPWLDPFASPRPRRGGGGRFANPFGGGATLGSLGSAQLMFTMLGRLCERAHACGGPIDQMCSIVDGFGPLPPVPSCAAAQRCMQAIDQVDVCGSSSSLQLDFTRVFATVQDCMDAMRC